MCVCCVCVFAVRFTRVRACVYVRASMRVHILKIKCFISRPGEIRMVEDLL